MGSTYANLASKHANMQAALSRAHDATIRAIETGTILQARLDKLARLAIAATAGPRRSEARKAVREFVHELYGRSGPPSEHKEP